MSLFFSREHTNMRHLFRITVAMGIAVGPVRTAGDEDPGCNEDQNAECSCLLCRYHIYHILRSVSNRRGYRQDLTYCSFSAAIYSSVIFFILCAQKPQYLSEFIIQIRNPRNSPPFIYK